MAASPFAPSDEDESDADGYYGPAAKLLPQQPQISAASKDLSTVPAFIPGGMDMSKIHQVIATPLKNEYPGTETIADAAPGKINVYDPAKFTPPIRNHELTHEFQESRSDGSIPLPGGYSIAPFGRTASSAPLKYIAGNPKNYDYGGEAGLQAAMDSGKTMADFNPEQQANIVSDYKAKQDAYLAKAQAGKMTQADSKAMYQTYRTYHAPVQQLASVPGSFRGTMPSMGTLLGIGKPEPLAPAPPAPGLPPYDTPGFNVAPADPLLGGNSVPVKSWANKISGAAPKVGSGRGKR